jgi:hypothetical protein
MKFFLRVFLILAIATLGLPSLGLTGSIEYKATLTGTNESPPNASPGTGEADVFYDTTAHTLRVIVSFADLLDTTTAAHIHAPTATPFTGTAGVATQVPTFINFPLGVTSGSYDHTFDTTLDSTYNPAFVTANGGTAASAEAALLGALADGKAYLNIHTTSFPAGEISGFLAPAPVPATMLLFGSGLAGLAGIRFRKNRK